MIETFYSADALNTISAFINALVIGFALGWCFEQSGFGSSKKNSGIFRLSDMTIVKTLCTAIITTMLLISALRLFGIISNANTKTIDSYIWLSILGGLIFSVTYNMSGWTPGTSIVGAVSGKIDAWIYILSCCLGFIFIEKTYNYHGFIYDSLLIKEESFIYNMLGFQQTQVLLPIVVVLLTILWICEFISEDYSGVEVVKKGKFLWIFTMFSVICATSFAFMPKIKNNEKVIQQNESEEDTQKTKNEVTNLNNIVDLEEIKSAKQLAQINAIEPENFAREKVKGEKKIVLVDLREKEEYEKYNILGSINLESETICLSLNRFKDFDRIILIGEEKVLLDVYEELNKKGYNNIYVLDGGINNFKEKILKPLEERNIDYTDEEKEEILSWQKIFNANVAVSSFAEPMNIDMLMGK